MAKKGPALAGLAAGIALAATASAGETAGSTPLVSAEPHFVALDDIVVPIVDGDTVTGRLRFRAVIAARDDAGAERLAARKPRLRSATLIAGLEFSRLHAAGLRPVDAAALAQALADALQPSNPDITRVLLVKSSAESG